MCIISGAWGSVQIFSHGSVRMLPRVTPPSQLWQGTTVPSGVIAMLLRHAPQEGMSRRPRPRSVSSGSATTEGSVATRLSAAELEDVLHDAVEIAASLGMELDFTSPGWLPEETPRGVRLSYDGLRVRV